MKNQAATLPFHAYTYISPNPLTQVFLGTTIIRGIAIRIALYASMPRERTSAQSSVADPRVKGCVRGL